MEKAFLNYMAEDAILLRENSMPVEGLDDIRDIYEKSDDSQFQLTWEPLNAFISESGDLGYTYGIYTLKSGEEESQGTYVSIWRIGMDGEYELVFDTGNKGIGN